MKTSKALQVYTARGKKTTRATGESYWITRGSRCLAVSFNPPIDSINWFFVFRVLFAIAIFDYILFALIGTDLFSFVLSIL